MFNLSFTQITGYAICEIFRFWWSVIEFQVVKSWFSPYSSPCEICRFIWQYLCIYINLHISQGELYHSASQPVLDALLDALTTCTILHLGQTATCSPQSTCTEPGRSSCIFPADVNWRHICQLTLTFALTTLTLLFTRYLTDPGPINHKTVISRL